MRKQTILAGLCALLLLQCCMAAPKRSSGHSSSEESKEKAHRKSAKKDAADSSAESSEEQATANSPATANNTPISHMTDMMPAAFSELKNLRKDLQHLVRDEHVKKVQTVAMQAAVNDINNYVKKLKQFEKQTSSSEEQEEELSFFALLTEGHDLLQRLNTTNATNPSAEQVVLDMAWKKHGPKEPHTPVDWSKLKAELAAQPQPDQPEEPTKKAYDWRKDLQKTGDAGQTPDMVKKYMEMFLLFG